MFLLRNISVLKRKVYTAFWYIALCILTEVDRRFGCFLPPSLG
jgi:hypothetical protein